MLVDMGWHIAGAYLESCNCEAICPCRMIDGVPGGRSTYGECYGALCWRIDDGHVDDVPLSGLNVALTIRYHDDEEGSPWTIVLHVDERGDTDQRARLEQIFLGDLGGDMLRLPWIRKQRNVVAVRPSRIEIEHGPDGHSLAIAERVTLRANRPVERDSTVTCVIPGHHEPGREYYADSFVVDDEPFHWQLSGNCAFTSAFSYSS
jgi:hypothetical protein